ncbi:two-component system sensor histidine kinase CreC [Pseudoduganella sp. FT25W]|uniref:histidine kinase n=1 Tax=Duganella alba TaxID=2666081 RepID=A0A6L5QEP0_9BURK|nr:two-component system sensor histidine kinase CreC [Duganella alba]MRX07998.1 two-component system sensor histidine kinase CreC [Duganella alba]MRX16465.1 two-component system sensor histidine kinase CreC [Duganella alba]
MKIGLRILLGYFLIVGLAAWFLLNVFVAEVKPGVRATLEDTLVDTAELLAGVVAGDLKNGVPALANVEHYARRSIEVKIGGVLKRKLDFRIYITDARGIVVYDSANLALGQDYSRWNDVYLTLQGKYGARSTRSVEGDDRSTVMYVAAPVRDGERIIGALTVAKPIASVQAFVDRSQRKILQRGTLLLVLSLLIGLAVAWWLARALRQLMHYVSEVEAGRKAVPPSLGNNEIGTLARALHAMRTRLEGKEYAEQLMHTLAHELKSPIAAIQGSAELLSEDMPRAEFRHFLDNILSQNARQKQLIDKLLALVRVEQQQGLEAAEPVALDALLRQVAADAASQLRARALNVRLELPDTPLSVRGDALLLRQALGNLLDNAIGFAPAGSQIVLALAAEMAQAVVSVGDSGPGIPAYALDKVFDRFYSLPRPGGSKSTGLGLPFVREVAALHGGTVSVANAGEGGCRAVLRLPLPLVR